MTCTKRSSKNKEKMADHIGDLETSFKMLTNDGNPINELKQVAILLLSSHSHGTYDAVVAAIRTMDESKTTWDIVSTRLIEECNSKVIKANSEGQGISSGMKGGTAAITKSKPVKRVCTLCKRQSHEVEDCYFNHDSPKY